MHRRRRRPQFSFDIEYLYPLLERTVYLTADPDMYFNPDARAFNADAEKHDTSEPGYQIVLYLKVDDKQ